MNITIHENREDYTPVELAELAQAFKLLETKAKAGNLTFEETRIRIAYLRLQREGNFRIVVDAKARKKAAAKPKATTTGGRKPAQKKLSAKEQTKADIVLAQQLKVRKELNGELTQEEEAFLSRMLDNPVPTLN